MATSSLLEKLLEGRSEEFKRKVFQLVSQTGYSEGTPYSSSY
jgi:hypothetical protein